MATLENATAPGNVSVAFRAADELAGSLAVDSLKLKADAAVTAARAVRSPQDRVDFVGTLGPFIGQCLAEDRYDMARQTAELALAAARAADPVLARQAAACLQQVRESQAASADASAAAEVLRRKPTDPEANLTLGKFRCFVKDDWAHGLPLLVAGSDPALKGLALQELTGAASPEAQVAVGDGWRDEAETFPVGPAKPVARRHAAGWYGRAVAFLAKGLLRDKLELRIQAVVAAALGSGAAESNPRRTAGRGLAGPEPAELTVPGNWDAIRRARRNPVDPAGHGRPLWAAGKTAGGGNAERRLQLRLDRAAPGSRLISRETR